MVASRAMRGPIDVSVWQPARGPRPPLGARPNSTAG